MKLRAQRQIPKIRWPEAFRSTAALLVISSILAILTAPVYLMVFGPWIDDSLNWAYNYFADGRYHLADSITFPFGPLSFLLQPLTMRNNFFVALSVHVVMATAFSFVVFLTQRSRGHLYPATTACALLVLLSVCDLQLLLIGLVVSLITLHRLTGRRILVPVYIMLAVFALLIKTYCGVICGWLIGAEIIYRLGRSHYRPALQNAALYILFFVVGWLLIFGDLSEVGNFLLAQLQLSLDISEAMQFYNANLNWWLIGLMIVAVLATFVMIDEPLGKQYYLLMIVPVFAAWKHGMGRAEIIHMSGFLHFLLLFVILLWLLSPQRHPRVIIVSMIAPVSFALQLLMYEGWRPESSMHLFRLKDLAHSLFQYDSLVKRKEAENAHATRHQHLSQPVKGMLGGSTVDIYPWNYSLIAVNELNWQPRPVLNSYAAYTPWLDRRDSLHFSSEDAPQFILWQYSDPNYRGLQLESIDNRFLLNDEPLALPSLLANYERRLTEENIMVFEKRKRPLQIDRKRVDKPVRTDFSEWIDVPQLQSGSVLRAKISMDKNLTGALRSLLYKGQIFYLYYELEDGRVLSHRIIPKNAAYGVWLTPFLPLPGLTGPATVSRIMVQCDNPSKMRKEIAIEFEKLTFLDGDEEQVVCGFFSDMCDNATGLIYTNVSRADLVTLPHHFREQSARITTDTFLTPPACYRIGPGENAGVFALPLDSLEIDEQHSYMLLFTANIRSGKDLEAAFVLSADSTLEGSTAFFNQELWEIVGGSTDWFHCSTYLNISGSELRMHRRLFFGVVNAATGQEAHVDDVGITLYRKN